MKFLIIDLVVVVILLGSARLYRRFCLSWINTHEKKKQIQYWIIPTTALYSATFCCISCYNVYIRFHFKCFQLVASYLERNIPSMSNYNYCNIYVRFRIYVYCRIISELGIMMYTLDPAHRRQACVHEMQRLQVEGAGPAGTAGMASLHIHGLSVPLRRDYIRHLNAGISCLVISLLFNRNIKK